jgi:hypothetical protein
MIRTVLGTFPSAIITGVEKNPELYAQLRRRYEGRPNVTIVQGDIADYLEQGKRHDLALCMMSTIGNIARPAIIEGLVNTSSALVFSAYNSRFDAKRAEMYRARGHKDFQLVGQECRFSDPWSNGLVSRSFCEEELRALFRKGRAQITSLEERGILYFCTAIREA